MAVKIATIGAGSWGTAIANVFADAGAEVTLWGRDPTVLGAINGKQENPRYLKDCSLSPRLRATSDLSHAIHQVEIVVCSIPSQEIRSVFAPVAAELKSKVIVNTAKGLEIGSLMRVSEIFRSLSPSARYVVVSGPSFAKEVVQRLPTAVTVAAEDGRLAALVQKRLATAYFRAYTTKDVIGVELAGALKNVVALASGIVRGAKLGFNAQAAVITRGLAEIARTGCKMGADPLTFPGLAGMGDLVLTCTGPLSRNLSLGMLIAEGKSMSEGIKSLHGVAEGIYTARAGRELATKLNIDMPILSEIHAILYEGKQPRSAVESLMGRDLKEEIG